MGEGGSAPQGAPSIGLDTIYECLGTLDLNRPLPWGPSRPDSFGRWSVGASSGRPVPTPGFALPDVPTRQTSSSGRPKSPRIQVVLPEELCARLSALADADSRTVSNMAKVLIQQGVERMERQLASRATVDAAALPPGSESLAPASPAAPASASAEIRAELEQRQQQVPRPLRRGPRRLRLQRPPL